MKAVMISAPNSNSGKTIVCSSLIAAMKMQGFDICGVKTGPDQVDRKILEQASGRRAGNVDRFLMTQEGMELSLGNLQSEYAIIEGVMGCFDGIGASSENSSYETAKSLDIFIVLTYTPSGEMFSMIPKLKGLLDFSEKRIKAIILNKIKPALYKTYKTMIENNLPITVLGFFPERPELCIYNTQLGLNTNETSAYKNFFNSIHEGVTEYIDMEKFISLFREVKTQTLTNLQRTKTKTAIAFDKCIDFYYTENISILEKYSDVKYFSPLEDSELPECDFVYFGSGQVKNFAEKLSNNSSMRESIKSFAEKGGTILAEGESVGYLFETFDSLPMCGIFNGNAESTDKLQSFGYKSLELMQDCFLGKKGGVLHAAEYHTSKAPATKKSLFNVTKYSTKKSYEDGYSYKNTFAFFQNINFVSCIATIYESLQKLTES